MIGKAILGAVFCSAVVILVATLLANVPGAPTLIARLGDWKSDLEALTFTCEDRPDLRPGDPVYAEESEAFALLGRVVEVSAGPPSRVRVAVDPFVLRQFGAKSHGYAMSPNRDLGWMARTLLPPDLRKRLVDDLRQTWDENKEQTIKLLRPHVMTLVGDVATILKDTLPAALRKHEEDRKRFFEAFTREVFQDDLAPLLEKEFMGRLEKRLTPVASDLGSEILKEIRFGEKLAFGWTAIFGSDKAKERKFKELVRDKILPQLKAKGPEILREAMTAVREGLADEDVRQQLDAALKETIAHETFQKFTGAVLKTWIAENAQLRQRLSAAFESPDFRAPVEALWKECEPKLEALLEDILDRGDGQGMDHRVVRVLRRLVLWKDARYLLLVSEGDPRIPADKDLRLEIGRDP